MGKNGYSGDDWFELNEISMGIGMILFLENQIFDVPIYS